tara:strand:- start:6114 stop:7112 length:999 start_codon:yes stop_codon:yes gene_type:complete
MVYIYKKTIHGKSYYYLKISKRIKDKVITKDIAYLGNDPSKIEKNLDSLESKYSKEIRKSYINIKKFIQGEYYLNKVIKSKLKKDPYFNKEQVEAIKLHYNQNFLKIHKLTQKETYENFLIDFAFNTTSLEGNTITLSETNRLLKENLTPKNRTLREIYDLQNTEKVFFEVLNSKKEISHDFIIKIHDDLLENIDKRKGYRIHDIRVLKSNFKATSFKYIKTDMDILLKWYHTNKKKLHPLVLAGIFHHKFEKIHPFSDGNGRTGRIILCYMLIRENYPPMIIKKSRRNDYLDVLSKGNKADLNNIDVKYYKDLINYLSEELNDGYWNNFNV